MSGSEPSSSISFAIALLIVVSVFNLTWGVLEFHYVGATKEVIEIIAFSFALFVVSSLMYFGKIGLSNKGMEKEAGKTDADSG